MSVVTTPELGHCYFAELYRTIVYILSLMHNS